VAKVHLQNLGKINKEILNFVLERGEARYTDMKNYLERNNICNEKTFVAHKRQLEFANLLGKKLSEKTDRPVYVIPSKVRKTIVSYFEREKMKHELGHIIDSANEEELERARKELEELKRKYERLQGEQKDMEPIREHLPLLLRLAKEYKEKLENQ